jgi:hypothetical protein
VKWRNHDKYKHRNGSVFFIKQKAEKLLIQFDANIKPLSWLTGAFIGAHSRPEIRIKVDNLGGYFSSVL